MIQLLTDKRSSEKDGSYRVGVHVQEQSIGKTLWLEEMVA